MGGCVLTECKKLDFAVVMVKSRGAMVREAAFQTADGGGSRENKGKG